LNGGIVAGNSVISSNGAAAFDTMEVAPGNARFFGLIQYFNSPRSSGLDELGVHSNGSVMRMGSTRDIKVNISNVDDSLPERLLNLPLRNWYDRYDLGMNLGEDTHKIQESEKGPVIDQDHLDSLGDDKPRRIHGLVAEELVG